MATIPPNVFPHSGSDPAAMVSMESGQSNPWGSIQVGQVHGHRCREPIRGAARQVRLEG